MSDGKQTFASQYFASHFYASGMWAGVGVEIEIVMPSTCRLATVKIPSRFVTVEIPSRFAVVRCER